MAGQPLELLTGGAGSVTAGAGAGRMPSQNANGALAGISGRAHHGVIGIVLVAVLILIVLDQLGFRFAVTAGRR